MVSLCELKIMILCELNLLIDLFPFEYILCSLFRVSCVAFLLFYLFLIVYPTRFIDIG